MYNNIRGDFLGLNFVIYVEINLKQNLQQEYIVINAVEILLYKIIIQENTKRQFWDVVWNYKQLNYWVENAVYVYK